MVKKGVDVAQEENSTVEGQKEEDENRVEANQINGCRLKK